MYSYKRIRCQSCGRDVAVMKDGKVTLHKTGVGGQRCEASLTEPS